MSHTFGAVSSSVCTSRRVPCTGRVCCWSTGGYLPDTCLSADLLHIHTQAVRTAVLELVVELIATSSAFVGNCLQVGWWCVAG